MTLRIDIGGGLHVAPGFLNIDIAHGEGIYRRDVIADGLPFDDDTVDAARASHFVEHVPAGRPRIDLFNEVHRVLMPGGTFQVIVPLVGTHHALADPTHVSLWVPESFQYFDGTIKPNADYGILRWQTLDWDVRDEWEGHWLATPIKAETR